MLITQVREYAVQKRDSAPEPYIKLLNEPKTKAYPPRRMLITSPIEIGKILRRIPEGSVVSLQYVSVMLAVTKRTHPHTNYAVRFRHHRQSNQYISFYFNHITFRKNRLTSNAVVKFNQRANPGPEYSSNKTICLSRRTVSDRFELSYLLRSVGCECGIIE